jgi:hypothetical protein
MTESPKIDPTSGVTLTFLTNPLYQAEILRSSADHQTQEKADKKFYRKRIISVTRGMLKGDAYPKGLKKAHDDYIRSIVQYLKMVDKKDILQNEYGELDASTVDVQCLKEFDINAANEQMMKIATEPPTLDGFVIAKEIEPEELPTPPQRKVVNLRAPGLKVKGLKKRTGKKKI